jgi:hypothetical protein
MSRATQLNILNFIMFQAGWFACVLGAANGMSWLGIVVVSLLVIIHVAMARQRLAELALLVTVGLLGFLWENFVASRGLLVFESAARAGNLAPYWMAALWVIFATTLNLSLAWLKYRKFIAAILAAVAGPLAYFAGMRLGALEIPELMAGMVVLAAGWAMLFPLSLLLAERLDGFVGIKEADSITIRGHHHV